MTEKINKQTIANANSSGLIIDYYSTPNTRTTYGRKPDFDLNKALKVIKNDPVVKGAIITLCDKVLETTWQLTGHDKRSRRTELEKKLRDLKFTGLLRKVVFNLLLYGNAFVEIVKKRKEVTDLNVLETTFIDILSSDNGDVYAYQQQMGNSDGPIRWTTDQVIHFKLTEITTNVWGEVDVQSLYDTILIKDSVREWLRWFFQTNQARGFYNIKNANSQKVKDFLSNLKANETDLTKPVIAQGEVTYQVLRNFGEEGKTFNELLLWLDNQLLALLNVPPIAIGFPDMSGRSNSVEQFKALNTRVANIQNILQEVITYELFPKIGYDKVMFEFGAIDDQTIKSKMEVVLMMRNSGFSDEAITEWMREQDIIFSTKELFVKPEEAVNSDPQGDFKPARMRKGEGEANKKLDNVSTREEQLVKNSNDYLIEPVDQWNEVMK